MIEAKDRAMQFKKELKALMKKWNTEIEIEDVSTNWRTNNVMKVYLPSIYNNGGDCIAESTSIDLGSYVDSN